MKRVLPLLTLLLGIFLAFPLSAANRLELKGVQIPLSSAEVVQGEEVTEFINRQPKVIREQLTERVIRHQTSEQKQKMVVVTDVDAEVWLNGGDLVTLVSGKPPTYATLVTLESRRCNACPWKPTVLSTPNTVIDTHPEDTHWIDVTRTWETRFLTHYGVPGSYSFQLYVMTLDGELLRYDFLYRPIAWYRFDGYACKNDNGSVGVKLLVSALKAWGDGEKFATLHVAGVVGTGTLSQKLFSQYEAEGMLVFSASDYQRHQGGWVSAVLYTEGLASIQNLYLEPLHALDPCPTGTGKGVLFTP